MRLSNIYKKIKEKPDLPKDIFILCVIFLVGIGAFLLGEYSTKEQKRGGDLRITEIPQTVEKNGQDAQQTPGVTTNVTQDTSFPGMYVGSRSGTTYHLPWCSGAKQIREENKVWFQSKEEAVAKGYKPATNCKGI